jgi:hypothetical protein
VSGEGGGDGRWEMGMGIRGWICDGGVEVEVDSFPFFLVVWLGLVFVVLKKYGVWFSRVQAPRKEEVVGIGYVSLA